jgi:hypothetical protein
VPDPTTEAQRTTSFDVVLPPDPELLRVVRLVASGLASFTDLGLDGVEAVRVAADELVSTLIQGSDGTAVTVHLATEPERLTIEARTTVDAASFSVDPLTDRILDEVATSHEFRVDGAEAIGRIDVALGG